MTIVLDGNSLSLFDFANVCSFKTKVSIAEESLRKIERIRQKVEKMAISDKAYYGINTGFGAMAETKITINDLRALQRNLIVSHAIGVGDPLTFEEARGLLLLRTNTLAKGHSGVRTVLLKNMVALLNSGCAPFVPRKGSVGASGDLGPLAHLALLLLGEGDAFILDKKVSATKALAYAGIERVVLEAKEGLALINGTQCMASVGALAILEAEKLCDLSDLIGACSLDALMGSTSPFDPRIQGVRPHPGQKLTSENIRQLIKGSEIHKSHVDCSQVQDAYSLRCMPQVHGATRDTVSYVRGVFEIELNSSSDNPLVFEEKNSEELEILSGGNFHGQPLALALDYLAIAVSELANISERRIEQMLNPSLSRGLPAFLTPNAGLNSGFMILQVAAAALVNENKVLCHPASSDSIPTSANREDHVSMGMTSANKTKTIIDNVYVVLAVELMSAVQALDLRSPLLSSEPIQKVKGTLRETVPYAHQDRLFGADLVETISLLKAGKLREVLGPISSGK